jgi:phage shock protein PspC (stress-responsive transcriptional regulator)
MIRRFTLLFTAIGLAICIAHYYGLDPKNMIIYSLSIPLWIASIFFDMKTVNVFTIYFFTFASWTLLGYILDRLILKSQLNK